jgi:hypothetical protein
LPVWLIMLLPAYLHVLWVLARWWHPQSVKTGSGMKQQDIDLIELNEAFASQSLAVIRELDLDPGRIVNVNGGAIALRSSAGLYRGKTIGTAF